MALTEKNDVPETGVNYGYQNGSISHRSTESDMLKSHLNGHSKNGLNGHVKVSYNNHYKISALNDIFYRPLSHCLFQIFRLSCECVLV